MIHSVTVDATHHVEVELTPDQQRQLAIDFLERLYGLPRDPHVHKGYVCSWEGQGGHNNDIEQEQLIRNGKPVKATKATAAVITVLKLLRKADLSEGQQGDEDDQ